MSAPQAAAITACTACAAVGGAAAGGAFSSGTTAEEHIHNEPQSDSTTVDSENKTQTPQVQEPTWKPLIEEIESSDRTYDSKIGKEYGHWLVGTYGTTAHPNNKWWEKSFKQYEEDKKTKASAGGFSTNFADTKVIHNFRDKTKTAEDDNKALNKVCDTIYKDDKTKLGSESEKKKLRDDLWRYCSSFGVAPLTIQDNTTETPASSTIGESKKAELLSVTVASNDIFWEHKNKEIRALGNKVTEKYFSEALKTESKKLKDICKDAYSKAKNLSGDTDAKEADVVKYCSYKAIPKSN